MRVALSEMRIGMKNSGVVWTESNQGSLALALAFTCFWQYKTNNVYAWTLGISWISCVIFVLSEVLFFQVDLTVFELTMKQLALQQNIVLCYD